MILESIATLGFYVFAFGVSGFIYNIIIFIFLRPPILPIADSTILSAIWCFLTFKTSALLFWNAKKYADVESFFPIIVTFTFKIVCIKMIWVLHILIALNICAGLLGIPIFMFLNVQGCIWSFVLVLTATISLRVSESKLLNEIHAYSADTLESIAWFGFYVFAFGFSGFIYNIITFIVLRPPILPIAGSTILPAIWCFLSFKMGAILCWNARKYADFLLLRAYMGEDSDSSD